MNVSTCLRHQFRHSSTASSCLGALLPKGGSQWPHRRRVGAASAVLVPWWSSGWESYILHAATKRMEHGGTWWKQQNRTSKHHHVRQKANMWMELHSNKTVCIHYISRQKNGARIAKERSTLWTSSWAPFSIFHWRGPNDQRPSIIPGWAWMQTPGPSRSWTALRTNCWSSRVPWAVAVDFCD